MLNHRFQDKVALVTGSSRGVGYAIAKRLLQSGAKVVITARGVNRLEESRKKLSQWGEVIALQGDVRKWEDARHMVESCVDHFGQLDILVNNAGLSMRGLFNDLE
ncbi:MAG: SDR family NAD(P)-dependent oxidoreductase, partial [Deltaproteobacteria bacterium]|nr:SDR family NAD(P)-dependent oxidoreductase [Deltaproteobacteria bacterium]